MLAFDLPCQTQRYLHVSRLQQIPISRNLMTLMNRLVSISLLPVQLTFRFLKGLLPKILRFKENMHPPKAPRGLWALATSIMYRMLAHPQMGKITGCATVMD